MTTKILREQTETETETETFVQAKRQAKTLIGLILKADGSVEEVEWSASSPSQILGGPVATIGEWSDLSVILLARLDSLSLPKNEHKLQAPFANNVIYGDILCIRVDYDSMTPINFTANEYETFIEGWNDENKPITTTPQTKQIQKSSVGDESVEGCQVDESEWEDALTSVRQLACHNADSLLDRFAETFLEINGRNPDASELRDMTQRVQEQLMDDSDINDITEQKISQVQDTDMNDTAYINNLLNSDLSHEAALKYEQIMGKAPTQTELLQIMKKISSLKIVDCDFDENDDDDYNPNDDNELPHDHQLKDENDSLLIMAKKNFFQLNNREPNQEELQNILHALQTNNNNFIFGSDYGDDDEDYDPTQDQQDQSDDCLEDDQSDESLQDN